VARFDVEYFQPAQGWRLASVEDAEVADDLIREMVEVLTGFCARLYGRPSARSRASVAVEVLGKAASMFLTQAYCVELDPNNKCRYALASYVGVVRFA
jgi:hypothetical protein